MTDTIEASTAAAEALDGLRDLLAHFESHPFLAEKWGGTDRLLICTHDADEFRRLAHELGGERVKRSDASFVFVRRNFGPIVVEVFAPHAVVCEQVQTGTRSVEVEKLPADVEAQIEALRAEHATVETVNEPVMEWICPDSLLGGAA